MALAEDAGAERFFIKKPKKSLSALRNLEKCKKESVFFEQEFIDRIGNKTYDKYVTFEWSLAPIGRAGNTFYNMRIFKGMFLEVYP